MIKRDFLPSRRIQLLRVRYYSAGFPKAAGKLNEAAKHFDKEAELLQSLKPLLSWESPEGADALRNAKACPLLREASESYGKAIDALEAALGFLE